MRLHELLEEGNAMSMRNIGINSVVGGGFSFFGKMAGYLGGGYLATTLAAAGLINPITATGFAVGGAVVGTFAGVFAGMAAANRALKKFGDNELEHLLKRLDKKVSQRDKLIERMHKKRENGQSISVYKSKTEDLTREQKQLGKELETAIKVQHIKTPFPDEELKFLVSVAKNAQQGNLTLFNIRNR